MHIAETIRERRGLPDRRGGDKWIEALTAAIQEDQVEILFQPQFTSRGNCLAGAEALSRWNHPRLGRIGAEALFDIAGRSGHAAELTRHIFMRSLAAAARWPGSLTLSLNVTAADLTGTGFADVVLAAFSETAFPPERLTLEITEQALVSELDHSAQVLERLADQGVAIVLDDFGAGYCNFRYLKRLPLHGLKLDRSMVEGIEHDPRDLSVFRGIMAMAWALDLEVTAEGVERQGQLDAIVREGCEKWQGFLGALPMSAEQFAEFAAR